MKQIIQDLKNGNIILEVVLASQVKTGAVLIKTARSFVSMGTESMFVEFGKAGSIGKPDLLSLILQNYLHLQINT